MIRAGNTRINCCNTVCLQAELLGPDVAERLVPWLFGGISASPVFAPRLPDIVGDLDEVRRVEVCSIACLGFYSAMT